MPQAFGNHREVLYKCSNKSKSVSIIRNSMLLQELRLPTDFVKIDPPECVKTRGLNYGENVLF